eukprot:NODE_8964_length_360_cov_16.216393.p2 GENE.NODE_8964_length_360_cov_16.216393~~NODE_8964_length_360_cov_16.216393.p2  ORF type:complete len:94 (+),score=9.71 NODE_8964_length_360_cov_16.216393:3-284(+)
MGGEGLRQRQRWVARASDVPLMMRCSAQLGACLHCGAGCVGGDSRLLDTLFGPHASQCLRVLSARGNGFFLPRGESELGCFGVTPASGKGASS